MVMPLLKKALNVAQAGERLLNEHVRSKLKARTVEKYSRTFNLHILPALGRIKLHDLSRAHVAQLHHSMRNAPYAANRTLAFLSKFISWAEAGRR